MRADESRFWLAPEEGGGLLASFTEDCEKLERLVRELGLLDPDEADVDESWVPTRENGRPDEGRVSAGSLSPDNGRSAAWWLYQGMSTGPLVWTWEIDGSSSFPVLAGNGLRGRRGPARTDPAVPRGYRGQR